jgi:hypothetical protein
VATTYSNVMEITCKGVYSFIHGNREDRTSYRNMALFVFTNQLLHKSKGSNPNIDGDPEHFGFSQDDVDRYGYYYLFLVNFPAYDEKIWDVKNADYLHLIPLRDNRGKER